MTSPTTPPLTPPTTPPMTTTPVATATTASMTADEIGYPPFDQVKPVADGVWIVDAAPIRPIGLPAPIRMTVIRLENGDLLLLSPTPYAPGLAAEVAGLGRIRHLVAPSFAHWMFLKDWAEACPEAETWAAPGLPERLQVRAKGLHFDHELGETPPPAWAGEIDQVVVRARPFAEVAFFHQPSWTLVLTDLVQNLEPQRTPPAWRGLIRMLGVAAPDGKAPTYLRWLLRTNAIEAAEAARRLVALRPERVIFAHGRWFERDATERLRQSLAWLTDPPRLRHRDEPLPSPGWMGVVLAVGVVGLGLALARRSQRRRR